MLNNYFLSNLLLNLYMNKIGVGRTLLVSFFIVTCQKKTNHFKQAWYHQSLSYLRNWLFDGCYKPLISCPLNLF